MSPLYLIISSSRHRGGLGHALAGGGELPGPLVQRRRHGARAPTPRSAATAPASCGRSASHSTRRVSVSVAGSSGDATQGAKHASLPCMMASHVCATAATSRRACARARALLKDGGGRVGGHAASGDVDPADGAEAPVDQQEAWRLVRRVARARRLDQRRPGGPHVTVHDDMRACARWSTRSSARATPSASARRRVATRAALTAASAPGAPRAARSRATARPT
jgi:hypothetical protein